MTWLLVAVVSYLLFAVAAVGDKVLLAGPLKHPSTYMVFVGLGSLLPVLATPFLGFPLPMAGGFFLSFFAGIAFAFGLYPYYRGIQEFEVSRVVPATGGLVPLLAFALGSVFLPGGQAVTPFTVTALVLLIGGSVLLSIRPGTRVSLKSLGYAFAASVFFVVSFVLVKEAYLIQSFWSAFLWMQIGSGFPALVLLLAAPHVKADMQKLSAPTAGNRRGKTALLFLGVNGSSAAAGILQHVALFLVPAAYFAFVNALQGVQYLFLLFLAVLLGRRFPKIFHEHNTGTAFHGKLLGVILVVLGTVILLVINPTA